MHRARAINGLAVTCFFNTFANNLIKWHFCGKVVTRLRKRCYEHPKKTRGSHCIKCGKEIPKDKRCIFRKYIACYSKDRPKAVCRVCGKIKIIQGRGACYSCYGRAARRIKEKRLPDSWLKIKISEKYRSAQKELYYELLNASEQSKK